MSGHTWCCVRRINASVLSLSYGSHGWCVISHQLRIISNDIIDRATKKKAVTPVDDMDAFLTKFGTHQAAAALIARDYNCPLYLGAHMAWLSEPYGEREFPIDPNEETLVNLVSTLASETPSNEGDDDSNKGSLHDNEEYTQHHPVIASIQFPSKNTRSKTHLMRNTTHTGHSGVLSTEDM